VDTTTGRGALFWLVTGLALGTAVVGLYSLHSPIVLFGAGSPLRPGVPSFNMLAGAPRPPSVVIRRGSFWVWYERSVPASRNVDRRVNVLGFNYDSGSRSAQFLRQLYGVGRVPQGVRAPIPSPGFVPPGLLPGGDSSAFVSPPNVPGPTAGFPGPGTVPPGPPQPPRQIQQVEIRLRLWTPFLSFSAYPCIVVIYSPIRRVRRRARNQCVDCGYSLIRNESGACPECGYACAGWVVPKWQRLAIAFISALVAGWLLEFVSNQTLLEYRLVAWLLRTLNMEYSVWLPMSTVRTLLCTIVAVGVYAYLSPERFRERE